MQYSINYFSLLQSHRIWNCILCFLKLPNLFHQCVQRQVKFPEYIHRILESHNKSVKDLISTTAIKNTSIFINVLQNKKKEGHSTDVKFEIYLTSQENEYIVWYFALQVCLLYSFVSWLFFVFFFSVLTDCFLQRNKSITNSDHSLTYGKMDLFSSRI